MFELTLQRGVDIVTELIDGLSLPLYSRALCQSGVKILRVVEV